MKNNYNKKKEDKIREIFPHIWNTYTHIFNDRRRVEDKLNYLFAINTLFIIGYIEFFDININSSILRLIPLIFLSISAITLFLQFVSKRVWVPWFKKKQITEFIDKNQFYIKSLEEIYACICDTHDYMMEKAKFFIVCYTLIFYSVVVMIIIVLLGLKLDQLKTGFIVFILIISFITHYFIIKNSEKGYAETSHLKSGKIRLHFENWLKDEKNKIQKN